MKQIKGLLSLATIIGMIVVSGCTKDVYDSSKTPDTTPTDNPLGEGFSAPSDFSWSMVNTVNLNVEVKDEFGGQYDYLIEVFTTNPLSDASATPIAAGVAQKSTGYIYTAEVSVPKTVERLFIRQTDPKQRKEVYEYAVPENGGALNCKLYYTGSSSTKALSTRSVGSSNFAYNTAVSAGVTDPTDPNYKEADTFSNIPTTSDQPISTWNNGNAMEFGNGAKLIIGSEYTAQHPYTKTLQVVAGGKMTIYVEGVWKPSAINYAFDIYVLNGGIIASDNNLTFGNTTNLSIQSGSTISAGGTLTLKSQNVKNFGDIDANTLIIDEATTLFNQGSIKIDGTNTSSIGSNSTVVYNHGLIEGNKLNLVGAKILNVKTGTINIQNSLYLNSGSVFNYGKVMLDEKNATLGSNGGTTYFVNHSEGTLNSYNIYNGLTVYNDGFIETTNFQNNGSNDALYNSCTLVVKNEFKFRKVVLDKGSISGGRVSESSDEWAPVPTVTALNDATFTMQNGSMIKVETFNGGNPCTFTATGDDTSIIAAQIFKYTGNTNISGNLVWAVDNDNPSQPWMKQGDGIANTGYDESKYTIETCGGYYAPGNPGNPTPSDPTFPITVVDATNYTYAFEDLWPVYGDFDLNDIVLTLKNKSVKTNGNGSLKSSQFQISLDAVGASKMLGVGIRFLGLPANTNLKSFTVNGNSVSFENGQQLPTFILFNDAHAEFGFTDSRPFINTQKDASTNRASKTYDVALTFNDNNLDESAFNINNLDVFIITKAATASTKRTEVHIAGYAPTNLADTSLFKTGNDDSSAGHYYLSTENLAWGIVLPVDFAWPLETKKVIDVYSSFKSWVSSGGTKDGEWYNTHNSNVYSNQ